MKILACLILSLFIASITCKRFLADVQEDPRAHLCNDTLPYQVCNGIYSIGDRCVAHMQQAIFDCPNYCGICQFRPEYNCSNKAFPRIDCATVTQDMCHNAQLINVIVQDCPNMCGFCLDRGCFDAGPSGASCNSTLCTTPGLESFVKTQCRRTCGFCDLPVPTPNPSPTCADNNNNCAFWVRTGFCQSTFYTIAQKKAYCGKSCRLC